MTCCECMPSDHDIRGSRRSTCAQQFGAQFPRPSGRIKVERLHWDLAKKDFESDPIRSGLGELDAGECLEDCHRAERGEQPLSFELIQVGKGPDIPAEQVDEDASV